MQSFNEYLEEQVDLKRNCTIRFKDVQGAVSEIKARILKIDEVSGRQMIETDAGFAIGVDQIISINGYLQENYC